MNNIKGLKYPLLIIALNTLLLTILLGCSLHSEPSDSELSTDCVNKGITHYKKFEYFEAVVDMDKALELDSSNSQAYPYLMKSLIKRDSLVQKYFNFVTADSSSSIGILDSSTVIQDSIYKIVKHLEEIRAIYESKANSNSLDRNFTQIDFVVNDIKIMYGIVAMIDFNSDGHINIDDKIDKSEFEIIMP